ncbi:MAG TPA: hypothetical protein VGI58_09980 [Streptosporangiaceae bacterium]
MSFVPQAVVVSDGNTLPIGAASLRRDGKRADPAGGYRLTFPSMQAFYAEASRVRAALKDTSYDRADDWSGGVSFLDLADLVEHGWQDMVARSLEVSDRAIKAAATTVEDSLPALHYDVTGDVVDIGRYYSGEPECMIDWPLQPVLKDGLAVTLISSACFSAAIATGTIVRRGIAIAALAEALTGLGYAVEVVVDISAGPEDGVRQFGSSLQVTAKEVHEDLNMPRVIYGLAHPSVLRKLAFLVWDGSARRDEVQNSGFGPVNRPAADRSDAIVIEGLDVRQYNWDDPEAFIREHFVRLGLIEG